MTAMRIFTEFDGDKYRLMVDDGRMSATPAGQRLFRAPPHPEIEFSHATAEAAEDDARKLRAYLSALVEKKVSKKRTALNAA